MARIDWKRHFGPEVKFLTCLRSQAAKVFGLKPQQISIGELALPTPGATTRAYGLHFDVVTNQVRIPMFVSFPLDRSRPPITSVVFVAPQSVNDIVLKNQRAFAKNIVARLKAAGA